MRAARHGPWHLIHGDIRANLDKLQHGPKPKDVVSCKIRALMGLRVDPVSLVPGVQLLAEAPWSTKLVEQGHTLSSRLLRYHRYSTSETLRARTVVATTKQLVSPTAPKAKRNIEKVRGRLRKLRKSHSLPSWEAGRRSWERCFGMLDLATRRLRVSCRSAPESCTSSFQIVEGEISRGAAGAGCSGTRAA